MAVLTAVQTSIKTIYKQSKGNEIKGFPKDYVYMSVFTFTFHRKGDTQVPVIPRLWDPHTGAAHGARRTRRGQIARGSPASVRRAPHAARRADPVGGLVTSLFYYAYLKT